MPASGLQHLFTKELSALLSAHKDSAEQSSESAGRSTNPKLQRLFRTGADINKKQAKRVEKIFASARLTPGEHPNTIIAGIDEANAALRSELTGAQERDLAQISMAQAAIHYYIAKYGALRAYAQTLGYGKAAALLSQSLEENRAGDKQFSKIARDIMVGSYKADFPTNEGSSALGSILQLLTVAGMTLTALKAVKQQRARH